MYRYKYLTETGIQKGFSNANTLEKFLGQMDEQGILDDIVTYNKVYYRKNSNIFRTKEKVLFYRYLYGMLKTGANIRDSFVYLKEQYTKKKQITFIDNVISNVDNGVKLSSVLENYTEFKALEIAMIKVGEESGDLIDSIHRIGEHTSKEYKTNRKINSALIYPFLMLTITYIISIGLLRSVLPKFIDIIEADASNDSLNRIIDITEYVKSVSISWFIAIYVVAVIFLYNSRKHIKNIMTKIIMSNRFTRPILVQFENLKFLTYYEMLTRAGILPDRIFGILKNESSKQYSVVYEEIEEKVREGERVSKCLNKIYFANIVIAGFKSGENSGDMEYSLSNTREFLEEEQAILEQRVLDTVPTVIVTILGIVAFMIGTIIIRDVYLPALDSLM